jgi:hypothetical protein
MGTIVHKVLEIFGRIKLAKQNNQLTIEDDLCGPLTVKDLDTVEGQQKHLQNLLEKVYNHYIKGNTIHRWETQDFLDCKNWINKTLDFNNGQFNPINLNIVAVEQEFDITINEPWAVYNYNGTDGLLSIKGTIDLIVKSVNGTYEIVDWKTGKTRRNWATGEEKDYDKLSNDPQLNIYYLATKYLYPHLKQVLITIYYINAGGPFTLYFSEENIPKVYELLRKKYEKIKSTQVPELHKSFFCYRVCDAGMNTFKNTSIKPMIEFREGQVCKKGELMSICEQCKFETERKGIDKVIQEYTAEGHMIDYYQNPGA